jgi:hypothetical protein
VTAETVATVVTAVVADVTVEIAVTARAVTKFVT